MTIRVSRGFRELYSSAEFSESISTEWMPWLLDGLELGDDIVDVAAGPGVAVRSLRTAGRQVTVAQLAPEFTAELTGLFACDRAVGVRDVDPTCLPFSDGHFTAATAVLSLHHVPSTEQQDRALAELARVLRPGAVLAGLNAIDGPHFRRMNDDGCCVPIDPLSFAERLQRAGFIDVELTVWSFVRFTARVPTPELVADQDSGRPETKR